ncbi:MAG: hypothetical protein AAGM84_04290 [Pseudomonadota bacterium]
MSWAVNIAMGALFVVWAAFMFYALFAVRRIAAGKTGSLNPGVGATLKAWRVWFTDPASRPRALTLVWLTGAVLLMTGVNAWLMEAAQ